MIQPIDIVDCLAPGCLAIRLQCRFWLNDEDQEKCDAIPAGGGPRKLLATRDGRPILG